MPDEFEFDTVINRMNTNSVKWDVQEGQLPMTIADMDFKTSPAIISALEKKISTRIYGYEIPKDDYYQSIIRWCASKYNWEPAKEWILYCNGVIPAISVIIQRLSNVGDNIVMLTPICNAYFNVIFDNGRHVIEVPLDYDASVNEYSINWDLLENAFSNGHASLMLLANPCNPTGICWKQSELTTILRMAHTYHITVVCDEIWGDLVLEPGQSYTPILSLPKDLTNVAIMLTGTSKTFNTPGLHSASAIIPDRTLREICSRGFAIADIISPGTTSLQGTIAAYQKSDDWIAALKNYLWGNIDHAKQFLSSTIPEIKPVPSQATYLMWLDCSALLASSRGKTSRDLANYLKEDTGLILLSGDKFRGNGRMFLRMNVACPRSELDDALGRLQRGVSDFQSGMAPASELQEAQSSTQKPASSN